MRWMTSLLGEWALFTKGRNFSADGSHLPIAILQESMTLDRSDIEDVRAVLEGPPETARAFLQLVTHPADIAEAFTALDEKQWPNLLRLIDDEELRAEVVTQFDDAATELFLKHIDSKDLPGLVREMETDDAADLIGEMSPSDQRKSLAALDEEDRADVERLLTFPDDSAGGIMQTEMVVVDIDQSTSQVTERVRDFAEQGISLHCVYVTEKERLIGYIDLVDLLVHGPKVQLREFLSPLVASVQPLVDQEEVVAIFRKYDLVTLPVIDEKGKILGRIVHDDVVEVLDEEAEEDVFRMAGTNVEELLYKDRAIPIARVRLPWLVVNLLGSLFCAFLLHLYEDVLAKAILVASFIPVITAMGGNVGTQSATILIRGFATERLDLSDIPRLAFKEFRVGAIMGILCGGFVGIVASFLFGGVHLVLGGVVAISMVSAMTVAAVVGTLAPATLKRFGIDPAISASPFVTTSNDLLGIIIYMSLALFFLDKMS